MLIERSSMNILKSRIMVGAVRERVKLSQGQKSSNGRGDLIVNN